MLLFFQVLFVAVAGQLSVPSHTVCGHNACYTAHTGSKPFQEALASCKANGGNLVTAKDPEEALHIQDLLSTLAPGPPPSRKWKFWMGLQLPQRHCYQQYKLLRGFLWTAGGDQTTYSNWGREPLGTCTARRCVHITVSHSRNSSEDFKWSDGVCTQHLDGYLCKFSFKGMCQAIGLNGTGMVTYSTPFNAESSSLTLVPFGSLAKVSCEEAPAMGYVLCLEKSQGSFGWSKDGPFCAPPSGCTLENGGCAQLCVSEGGRRHHCQCHEGYQLGGDQHSCQLLDHCQVAPCQYRCLHLSVGFRCTCPLGYGLAENGRNCLDIDECANASHCPQLCINSPGSFSCRCTKGFVLMDGQCQDLDECAAWPCAQMCQNTEGSYRCHCRAGYVSSGHSCLDLDECTGHPCQRACSNTEGSFHCSCPGGYTLAEDGVSCAPQDLATTLIASPPDLTSAGDWSAPTPAGIGIHTTHLGTTSGHMDSAATESERPGVPTVGGQREGTGADFSTGRGPPITSPTGRVRTPTQGGDQEPRAWLLPCVLGSAAMLLLLCSLVLVLCCRHRSGEGKATDFHSWIQAAGPSSFRTPGKATSAGCHTAADNYMELEANQTAI